jgi:hypothetical protein
MVNDNKDFYQNGKIYKIVDNTNGNIYIGSTCKKLCQRIAQHRASYKTYLDGKTDYMTSYDIIENAYFDIILIENYPCDTKEQLHARERFYIETNNCLNKYIPTRNRAEYREDNKDKIKKYLTEYREDNKEKIKEQTKKYYDANKDKLLEQKQEYRKENKDKIKEQKQKHDKKYYESNKDKIKEKTKKNYEKNKEKLSQNVLCEFCNCEIRYDYKPRHNKTLRHLNNVEKATIKEVPDI